MRLPPLIRDIFRSRLVRPDMGRTHDLFFELSNKHRVNILRTLAEKPGSITAVRAPEFIDRIHRHKKIPGPRHRGTLSVQAKDG